VVAVSGGVDSMVLLDLLVPKPKLKLVVAHFDHGIRKDSSLDRQLVQKKAQVYGLPFVFDEGKLGPGASEAEARKARYDFLQSTRQATGARAIVTAHHQDDRLETAFINLLRGTSRRGLTSLKDTPELRRPLLHLTKRQLIEYAKANGIEWREDSTNKDTNYTRNHVRHKLLPLLTQRKRTQLIDELNQLAKINHQLDEALALHLHLQPGVDELDRQWFILLPHVAAREIMAAWLRKHGVGDVDTKGLERLVSAGKTYKTGQRTDVNAQFVLVINKTTLALKTRDR